MLAIRETALSKLKPWPDNPRVNEHAVESVAKSIRTFGFNVPILCDQDMTIIAGHTRWKAAKQLGMLSVPVIKLQLTGAQRGAFSVTDNKTAEIADWDFPKLRHVLEELQSQEMDLSTLGFLDSELQALLVPEKDFDWKAFDADLASEQKSLYVLFPVKIPYDMKDAVKSAIEDFATDKGIREKDSAIAAGMALASLLGLSR